MDGVTDVRALPANQESPSAPSAPSAPDAPDAPDAPTGPKVVDGRVQIQATLADPVDCAEAEKTVISIRTAVHAIPGADALVGGFTAVNLDTRIASDRDRNDDEPTQGVQ